MIQPERRAAVYARISRDRDGTGLGVDRQCDDARRLIAQRGWAENAQYVDNNITGSGRVARPQFKALLKAVESGEIQAVVAWDLSRLARNARDRLALVEACQERGVVVALVNGQDLDPTSSSGRMLIDILGAIAVGELDTMRDRIRGEKRQAAVAGRYRGGPRPYGYEADGRTLRPDEADALRDVTERILAGESVISVTRWLNDTGRFTTTGARWEPVSVRRVLVRARNCGLLEREHRGEKRKDPDIVGPGDWTPIITESQWRQVRRLLTDPRRRVSPSNDSRWLGAGVYLCGRCGDGTTMKSGTTRSRGGYVPAYRCSKHPHLSRLSGPLDTAIEALAIERLSRPDRRLLLASENENVDVDALHAERAEAEAGLSDLARMVSRRLLTETEAEDAIQERRADIDRLNKEIESATAASPLAGFADADDVQTAWDNATIGRRKAVVHFLMNVTILPARRGPKFKPESLAVEWKQ